MSESNPNYSAASNPSGGAAVGSQPQPPDFQQLVALLGNLMPLLLHFQSQVREPPFQAVLGNAMVPEPVLDHYAAISLVEDIIAGSLRSLSGYLEANAAQNASLNNCIPIVAQATHCFAAHNYAQALNLIWAAYRAITTIRAVDPRIPPLRPGGQPPSDQPSSIH
jgi:hypothetical protein